MMYPPSISKLVKARAFRAKNGELGILPTDCAHFLDACQSDGIDVLGWELWISNHTLGSDNRPTPSRGLWCGMIPVRSEHKPTVIGGSGDINETRRQLAELELDTEIQEEWLPHIRVNITLSA